MQSFLLPLLILDQKIFYFINVGLAVPFLDFSMPIITDQSNWYIPSMILWSLLVWKGGRSGRIVAFLLIPTLVLTDQLAGSVLKPWIGRLRPCKTLEEFRLLVHCGGKYSFPSVHATNISAAAFLFAYYLKKFTPLYVTIALIVGFSRIYVGVHFPLDVLGGYFTGIFCSMLIIQGFELGFNKRGFSKSWFRRR